MDISWNLYIMFKKKTVLKLLWILILFVEVGLCFRYDRDTERILCNTQCKALCAQDKAACFKPCYASNLYRFWIVNCDEPFLNCFGSCQVLAPSNRIANIFTKDVFDDDDTSGVYPPIPTLRISAIKSSTMLLSWDLPNSGDLVFHVVQMKNTNQPKWNIFQSEIVGNNLNVTLPDICLYEFRIMAINKFGSSGFSAPISVRNVPLEPIRNITVAGGVFYNRPTGEFIGLIQWEDISDLDDEVIEEYDWNDVTMLKCPRMSQNMQPIFMKFTGNHGRKFILMKVSRDAYGCVFTTQIKAKSICHDTGGWTNFTIDLTDCNAITKFPCPKTNISTPGNVENVTMRADRGKEPIQIRLNWSPPIDRGSLGIIDHYEIRWGKVTPPNTDPDFFFQESEFISTPNMTHLKNDSTTWTIPITADLKQDNQTDSLTFGFQIIPFAPTQMHVKYELFVIYTIEITTNTHPRKGTILMDGDGVQVVQIEKSLDLDVIWNFHAKNGPFSDPAIANRFNEFYAVKLGKSTKREDGTDIIDGQVHIVDGTDH